MSLKSKLLLIFLVVSTTFSIALPINYSEILKNTFFAAVILKCAQPIVTNLYNRKNQVFNVKTKVGLLSIKGQITHSHVYIKQLKELFEDKTIKAILLLVNCGGGAAASSEAIAHEITLLKKEYPKPIITLAENICASGAYYIAASTDYIIVPPSCLVGSIGSYISLDFNFKEFLAQHNIYYEAIYAGDYKLAGDSFSTLTPDQKQLLQSIAQSSYETFTNHVALCRTLNIEEKDKWANGKLFTGIQAKDLHLIDLVGSWSDALKKLKELAMIQGTIAWVHPEKPKTWWNIFMPGNTDERETIPASYSMLVEKLLAVFTQLMH